MYLTGNQEKDNCYYDEIYARGYNTGGYYPLYNQVIRMIREASNPRVLEIGCGIGDLGKMIIDSGIAYRGFDFSEKAVECAQTLCPQGIFAVGDAYDRRYFVPGDYNTVVALEVLEHVEDFRVIENIPDGVRLIASVPNYIDTAHLRLYQDPQRDIIDRFRPYLKTTEVKSLSPDKIITPQSKIIFLFQGIRESVTPFETGESIKVSPAETGRNDPCPCGSGRKYKKCCLIED